jgi:hypothetical protein
MMAAEHYDPPERPLRDVLRPLDAPDTLRWLTGVVTAVQLATAPYTVTVRLADGSSTGALTFLGWWVPRINDVCHLIQQGPSLLVLGAVSPTQTKIDPHRHAAADIDGTIIVAPPTPPAPPAPPPGPPTVRTVNLGPIDQAYWDPTYGVWKGDDLIQGGPNRRPFWFYGGAIAAAKGAGTITGGSIYVARVSGTHGVNGRANVRLGVHGYATRPGSGGAAHGAVEVPATLLRGEGANVPLTGAQLGALNAGAAGLGLEPGNSSYSSADYLRAVIGGASGQLSLTING